MFHGHNLTEQEIRQRAYELWMLRVEAGQKGNALSDWFQAEAELEEKHAAELEKQKHPASDKNTANQPAEKPAEPAVSPQSH
jgi:hypothetical protein